MDVKNFLNKILKGSMGENVPALVKDAFNKQFDNPLNPEWVKAREYYEAVFYKNELEHLARYLANGELESLKINMPLEEVPENIRGTAKKHGELMNAIAIHHHDLTTYELIVRDRDLIRYSLLLDLSGEVIEKEKL
jgi:hypothetical protein